MTTTTDPIAAALEAAQAAMAEQCDHRQIGTIELHNTQARVLPLDVNEMPLNGISTQITVRPGVFPLYTDGLVTYWLMPGRVIMRRHGDGLFTLNPSDDATGPVVVVPSKFYGDNEWAEFLRADAGSRYIVTRTDGGPS